MSASQPSSSWVPGADASGFPIANLCFGVAVDGPAPRLVVAIGDSALDLAAAWRAGLLNGLEIDPAVLSQPSMNAYLALDRRVHRAVRGRLQALLSDVSHRAAVEPLLAPQSGLTMCTPIEPGDFIDFYASHDHAVRAMGAMGAPPEVSPNWWSMPVGYHSRTSTILPSGAAIARPFGQRLKKGQPTLGPTRALDFELEIGFVACRETRVGESVSIDAFPDAVFGLVLLNDWSARDLQIWESRPLGPLLAKSFASQIGAWVVPLEALEAARVAAPSQSTALDYLRSDAPWGFDIDLEVSIQSERMREAGAAPCVVTRTNFRSMHWNSAQQLAHATVNGAAIRPGDLFGSGTVSGPEPESAGCLLERTVFGRSPIALSDEEQRGFLEDGDEVIFSGEARCGDARISFGTLRGRVCG